jgi:hypothetical protein
VRGDVEFIEGEQWCRRATVCATLALGADHAIEATVFRP